MISDDITYSKPIDTLISQQRSFAIWRVPGESVQFAMQTSGTVSLYQRLDELSNEAGFVMAPFQANDAQPIVVIRPDCTELPWLQPTAETATFAAETTAETELEADDYSTYCATFERFMEALQAGDFQKLVLSRQRKLLRPAGFSAGRSFEEAIARYPHSFVYLCNTPQTGTWMGCTPEIILSGREEALKTVALAGTQSLHQNELPVHWDAKNRKEQDVVADYIHCQLEELGITAKQSDPYPIRAGALSHLKSDFSFALPNGLSMGRLLQTLHPTPAVCGLPKAASFRFILANEGYNRHYYSGIVGWMNPSEKSDLYVNLRCLRMDADELTLFAGGGLLTSSELEAEWQETEAKMQTIRQICQPANEQTKTKAI